MNVKYSKEVKATIAEYAKSLLNYPISSERRKQKVRLLRQYLKSTIKSICQTIGTESFPICNYVDLGQVFIYNNEPTNRFLRQTNFSDESGTRWLISFMYIEGNKTILIYSLKQSQFVLKENKLNGKISLLLREYFQKHQPLNECRNYTVRMDESEFYDMVCSIAKRIINEEYRISSTDEDFVFDNGKIGHSIMTLKDDAGGLTRVIEDDGCYVPYQVTTDGKYVEQTHLYPELFNALKKLPNLPLH